MVLGSWRFMIGVVRLEECLDVIDCSTSGINNISVGCRSGDKVI